ncbi:hypothetical protein T492DRAFT_983994 [Pavlovales sp. CCMP2436]|nr:hypothetical protein T492DRAFT_983994 [Pavlovales sp. CCMP2436]
MASPRSRAWCITDFTNITKELMLEGYSKAEYLCFAPELCQPDPKTGERRLHMQAFSYFPNAVRRSTFAPAHLEVPKAPDLRDAAGYFAKGERDNPEDGYRVYLEDPCEDFYERGTLPEQGKRNDIKGAADMISEGGTRATRDGHQVPERTRDPAVPDYIAEATTSMTRSRLSPRERATTCRSRSPH